MMTARRIRFTQEYPVDFNGTQAAIRAGYAVESASSEACRLLADVEIQEAIEKRKRELADAAGVTCEWILQQYKQIAEADPNELTHVRRVNCRHCWGIDHEYQWDDREYRRALNAALDAKEPQMPPAADGGFGWDFTRDPNDACPECQGLGRELVHVADTRKAKGAAKRLFSGVKVTRDGIEIKTRNQDDALRVLAEYKGMLKKPIELSGPGGGAIPIAASITADELSDDLLAAIAAGASTPS